MRYLIHCAVILIFTFSCNFDDKMQTKSINNNLISKNKSNLVTLMKENAPFPCYYDTTYLNSVVRQSLLDSTYDIISNGFLIKYFIIHDQKEEYFSIIKSPYNNKYYYWDNCKWYKLDSTIKYKIIGYSNEGIVRHLINCKSLPVIPQVNDRECMLLSNIFNDIYKINKDIKNNSQIISLCTNVLISIYLPFESNFYTTCQDNVFRIIKEMHVDEDYFLNSLTTELDSSIRRNSTTDAKKFIEKLLSEKYTITNGIIYTNENCNICIFRIEFGIIIFVIKLDNAKIIINKYFIPDSRIVAHPIF